MIIVFYNLNFMKQGSIKASMIPNLYELDELPFLKRQISPWQRFKNKQKFLPTLRNLTYQSKNIFSKMFLFSFTQEIKEKKKQKYLHALTQRQIITLEQYYQLLNENVEQKEFSREVERIRIFQKEVYNYTEDFLGKNLIKFNSKHNFLEFNIYKSRDQFFLKATFSNYNYQLEFSQEQKLHPQPQPYQITLSLIKQHLNQRFSQIQSILYSLPFEKEIGLLYKTFYDDVYFLYDQFILKLQVFNNYPMLRLKTFVPVKFKDFKTGQPLEGPIFSSANPECMFGHFHGYNADTIKMIEGQHCQSCQFFIEQLQQNQMLMMLRDNVLNPQKRDIFYCPEYNRFKLLGKVPITIEQNQGEICEQKVIYRSTLQYLNYYHFKTNLKKMASKIRLTFQPQSKEEEFPLTFTLLNRKIPIIDPARGRYCRHFAFIDLRLYYLNFNQEDNTYRCPIPGCPQKINDSDILYLKEVVVLIQYAKFKCQECPQLVEASKILIDNYKKKLFVSYRVRENAAIVSKSDELIDFYKTLADPYIPFPEYSLGIKDKQRRAKIDEYMFGGLRQEMKQQEQIQEQQEQGDDDQSN